MPLIREARRREAQTGPHLPAAAITAYAGNQDRERALAAGFDRHVPKPIAPAAIVEAVRSMYSDSNEASSNCAGQLPGYRLQTSCAVSDEGR